MGHPDLLRQARASILASCVGRVSHRAKPHRGPLPLGVYAAQWLLQICFLCREIFNTVFFFKSYIIKPTQAMLSPESVRRKPLQAVWMQSSTNVPQLGDREAPCVSGWRGHPVGHAKLHPSLP